MGIENTMGIEHVPHIILGLAGALILIVFLLMALVVAALAAVVIGAGVLLVGRLIGRLASRLAGRDRGDVAQLAAGQITHTQAVLPYQATPVTAAPTRQPGTLQPEMPFISFDWAQQFRQPTFH